MLNESSWINQFDAQQHFHIEIETKTKKKVLWQLVNVPVDIYIDPQVHEICLWITARSLLAENWASQLTPLIAIIYTIFTHIVRPLMMIDWQSVIATRLNRTINH